MAKIQDDKHVPSFEGRPKLAVYFFFFEVCILKGGAIVVILVMFFLITAISNGSI